MVGRCRVKGCRGYLLALGLVAVNVGCATSDTGSAKAGDTGAENKQQQQEVATTEDDIVCRRERPTGSRISVKRCWSRADYDRMVRQTEQEMRRVQNSRDVAGSGN